MPKVKRTIVESCCRGGYHRAGREFLVEDLCPPLCHERWNSICPRVYALRNGAALDCGEIRAKCFDARCPDGGGVAYAVGNRLKKAAAFRTVNAEDEA